MLQRMRKNNKKGFTLVELIVVLVILAILAALLVPALTGYIDRAKKKQTVAETRQSVMAAQTIADEEYAKGTADAAIQTKICDSGASTTDQKALADVPGEVTAVTVTGGKVMSLTYTGTAYNCTYTYDNTTNTGTYGDPAKN